MVGGDSWPDKRHCLQVVFPLLLFFFEPPRVATGFHALPNVCQIFGTVRAPVFCRMCMGMVAPV